jgi:serine/threonine protein kinase
MPPMYTDLRKLMNFVKYSSLTMQQIKVQSTRAVIHIHARGVIHVDIKPENICIDLNCDSGDVHCKLIDFGSCVVFDEHCLREGDSVVSTNSKQGGVRTIRTTKGYQPPELISSGKLSPSGDIFSLGVVFGELIENCKEHGENLVEIRELALDMQMLDFRCRPTARDVSIRLGDLKTQQPVFRVMNIPIRGSGIANVLRRGMSYKNVADVFINDTSTGIHKLVSLVRSADINVICDAFWMLYEASLEQVRDTNADGVSVLAVFPYFDSRVHLSLECGLFYVKSLDTLSQIPQFTLSENMKGHICNLSLESRACARPIIRCLSNCRHNDGLHEWCCDDHRLWGVNHIKFVDFVESFAGDWDTSCADAASLLIK